MKRQINYYLHILLIFSVYLGEKYNIYYNEELITKNKLTDLSESILDKDGYYLNKLANKIIKR